MSDRSGHPLSLAIFGDFPEEGWPSMDLVEQMLLDQLRRPEFTSSVAALAVCPKYRKRFVNLPTLSQSLAARNADRLMNRFVDYPKHARRIRDGFEFECFHICDHSYAQLALELPADRTGVFCHDLDTFRCLIEPQRDRRPKWFRAMARRTLRGLQRAAVVFHTTSAVRDEIIKHQLVDAKKLVQAPCGVAPEYFLTTSQAEIADVPREFVLHVGSCIARKRIDVLLDAVAKAKASLVQVGGEWTDSQRAQIARLNLRIVQFPKQSRQALAKLYRRASVVLVTSEAEGFGLPVIEALACGTPVIASDIPSLREVGGDAVTYRSAGDSDGFAEAMVAKSFAPQERRIAQAGKYSWETHARIIVDTYQSLAGKAT